MGVRVGTNKPKFQCGSLNVKKIYKGTTQIYSSGNICTYTVRGVNYTQEYEEGQDVLHPTVVTPSLSGATFLGWSTSASSTSTVGSLVMGDSPIHLYSVFKYNNAGPYRIGQTPVTVGHDTGNPDPNKVIIGNIPAMNTNIYGSASFYTPKGTFVGGINSDDGWGERRANAFYAIGNTNSGILATARQGAESNWDGRTVTLNVPANGNQNVYICLSSSGTTGMLVYARAFVGLWVGDGVYTGDVTFIGRTVVG